MNSSAQRLKINSRSRSHVVCATNELVRETSKRKIKVSAFQYFRFYSYRMPCAIDGKPEEWIKPDQRPKKLQFGNFQITLCVRCGDAEGYFMCELRCRANNHFHTLLVRVCECAGHKLVENVSHEPSGHIPVFRWRRKKHTRFTSIEINYSDFSVSWKNAARKYRAHPRKYALMRFTEFWIRRKTKPTTS